ncbi:hypothetical protein J2X69_002068 [Algoriphagus sp. 4150]|nr:hypothetical protein [Algoriphagus sp. 4150]
MRKITITGLSNCLPHSMGKNFILEPRSLPTQLEEDIQFLISPSQTAKLSSLGGTIRAFPDL